MAGLGAWRCAEELSARLGVPVSRAAVEELAARGLLGFAGTFKGCQLYDVEGLAAVTAEAAVAAEAEAARGRLMNRVQAARYLRIRQADFDLMVRAALIVPDDRKRGEWQGWVWAETSDEQEAREEVQPGYELFRQWHRFESEWRPDREEARVPR